MLGETFAQLFRKYRLFCYRKLFAAVVILGGVLMLFK